MNKYLSHIKENIFVIVLTLTVFVALLSNKLIPVCILSLFVIWIFKEKNFRNFASKRKWIVPFLMYSLVFVIGLLFSDNLPVALRIMERHISFIALPIFIFCREWRASEIAVFKKFYVQLTIVLAIFSLINLGYFYATHVDFVKTMDDTYLQWKLPHLNGFHPTYFGFVIVIANIILSESILNSRSLLKSRPFFISIFLTFYLLYLSPRTAIICQFLVWIFIVYQLFKKNQRVQMNKFFVLITVLVGGVMIVFTSEYFLDKMMNAFHDKRFLLWDPAFEKIRSNYFILGEGLGNGRNYLNDFILENNLSQFKGTDLHNQYLMNYLDLGIFGFFALLLLLIRPYFLIRGKTLFLFTMVCVISMLSESFLYVIKGIVIFTILSSVFIINRTHVAELKALSK